MQAVWSISYVSVAFFLSLKENFIAYRSSKLSSRPVCIFEIHQLWQSGFSRVYSNCYYSCSFEVEIIKIGQSSHKMYHNNILNFQESTTIFNACTKKSGNILKAPRIYTLLIYFYFYCMVNQDGEVYYSAGSLFFFFLFFFLLSLDLVVWPILSDSFVSQNPSEVCAFHSLGTPTGGLSLEFEW